VPSPQAVPHNGDVHALSPSIDADLRLIRVHIDQQSQLLAVMHGMFATMQTQLEALHAQLAENEKKINKLLELVDVLHGHLNESSTNATQG
jgi:hypothetical protein